MSDNGLKMNQKRNKFYVYGLICPIDNVIKYIGASINPDLRYKKHLRNTDGTIDKIKWISNLIDSGKKPSMIILGEFTNEKECADAENSLCKKYSSNLLNDNIDKNRYKIGSKSDVTNNKASNSLEKYLKENKAVSVSEVAKLMYPKNKTAKSYLSKKLNKKDGFKFTLVDAENALEALKTLYGNINDLTLE